MEPKKAGSLTQPRGFLAPIVVTASRAEIQELAQHGIEKLNHSIGI